MNDLIRVLFISPDEHSRSCFDQSRIVELLERALPGERVELGRVADPPLVTIRSPRVVLLYQVSPDRLFEERIANVIRRWPDVPIVGIIGEQQGCGDVPVYGIPAALSDFVLCPLDGLELALRVRRVLSQEPLSTSRESAISRRVRVDSLLGDSAIFQAQVEKIPLFAGADATLLLQGETGTVKKCSPGPSTIIAHGRTKPSSRSTARPCRISCLRTSCSSTPRALIRVRPASRASWSLRPREHVLR